MPEAKAPKRKKSGIPNESASAAAARWAIARKAAIEEAHRRRMEQHEGELTEHHTFAPQKIAKNADENQLGQSRRSTSEPSSGLKKLRRIAQGSVAMARLR